MKKLVLTCLVALLCWGAQAQFFGVDPNRLNSIFSGVARVPYDNAVMIIKSTFSALEADTKGYRKAAEVAERLGNPADSLHNEALYLETMKLLSNSYVLSKSERERPKLLYELAKKNKIGDVATDLDLTVWGNGSRNLLNNDKIKLVFFNDLNCEACTMARAALAQSTVLSDCVNSGLLEVVSVYTGTNGKAWEKAEYPSWVISAWDKKQQVDDDEAYVLMITPLFYLLNSDNVVLVKNEPSFKRIEKAVAVVVENRDKDSAQLAKILFNK